MREQTPSSIRPLYMDHGVVCPVQGLDGGVDFLLYHLVAEAEVIGNYRVENDVGMGGAGDHAEIVDGDLIVDAAD